MAPNPKKPEYSPDDIDLLALAAHGISFVKRYRWLFLASTVLGLLFGIYKANSLTVKYKSSLLVRPVILTNQEEIEIVNTWNELLQKKEYESLSKQFNCRNELLGQVLQFKAREIQKVFTPTNPNAFTLDVLVRNNDILSELQTGIEYAFENNGYVTYKLAIRREKINTLIAKTEADIRQIDSTRQIMSAILRGTSKSSSPMIMDGSGVERQWMEMNDKILNLKEELQYTRGVQIIQGFQTFNTPVRKSWIVYIAISILVCVMFAYLIAQIIEINRRLKHRAVLLQLK